MLAIDLGRMLWYGWRGREIGYNCYKCKHIWNYVTRLNLLAQTQVSVASLAELANGSKVCLLRLCSAGKTYYAY